MKKFEIIFIKNLMTEQTIITTIKAETTEDAIKKIKDGCYEGEVLSMEFYDDTTATDNNIEISNIKEIKRK